MSVHERPEFMFEQRDARGGLSRRISPHLLQKNQLVLSQNAYLHRGGFRKTSGHSAILTAVPLTTRGLQTRRTYDMVSGSLTVAQYADGKCYRLSGQRFGVIGSGFSHAVKISFAEANRLLYATDGIVYRLWSGTRAQPMKTATNPAEVPRFIIYHQESNRMFAGRGATTKNRVWFSNLNAFQTWSTNDYFDIPESRLGEKIMGFARVKSSLCIFGERTISVLYGRTPADYTLRTLEWNRGCKFPMSIVEFDNYCLYAGADGIYKFDATGGSAKLSEAVQDLYDDVNKTNENGPYAYRDNEGHYVLSYASVSAGGNALANNRELTVLQPTPEAPFWHFQGPNTRGFNAYARYIGGADTDQTYAITGTTNGQFYQLEKGKDYAGTGVDMDLVTGQLDFDAPFERKVFQGLELHCETGGDYGIEVQYKIDDSPQWSKVMTVPLSRNGPEYGTTNSNVVNRERAIHPLYFPEDQALVGNYIQFRFRQRGADGKYQPVNMLMWRAWAKRWRAR